jgi:hypothetical protein
MLKKLFAFFQLVLLFGFFALSSAWGDNSCDRKGILIFDLMDISNNGNVKPTIYFLKDIDKICNYLNFINKVIPSLETSDSLIEVILHNDIKKYFLGLEEDKLEVADSYRWLSNSNSTIDIYIFYNQYYKLGSLIISEENREANISEDLKALFQVIPLAPSAYTKTMDKQYAVRLKHYYLEKERAIVTISVNLTDTRQTATSSKNTKDDKSDFNIKIISGTKEHFFLTADVPILKLGSVAFESNKDKDLGIKPKDTPKSIFIGLNIRPDDVLEKSFAKLPYLKLMAHFSTTPLDAVGIGIGWNFPYFKFLDKLGFKSDAICIFGGIFWAKESDSDSPDKKFRHQFRWGFSYDISRIGEWFKKK